MLLSHGLYIHVPWCQRRCPYCDFYLVVGKPNSNFSDLVIREFENQQDKFHNQPAQSLYFGGGTPSLLAPEYLKKIINYFTNNNNLQEITLEANPEDINLNLAYAWRDMGISRISLGFQSPENNILKYLGRKHTAQQAIDKISILQKSGFKNITVDLIIGVPQENTQNIANFIYMLDQKNINHISTYLLTIEKNTFFHKQINKNLLPNVNHDYQAKIYKYTQNLLLNLGFIQYDISSYARNPRSMSKHNQIYWAGGSYLGLGPGAHSMRYLASGAIERSHNKTPLNSYLQQENYYDREVLPAQDAFKEALMIGLRNMYLGVDPNILAERHKIITPKNLYIIFEELINLGYLAKNNNNYTITSHGALFSDYVMREILNLE